MTINNFIEFAKFASEYNLTDLEEFNEFYNKYSTICNCRQITKSIYAQKANESYRRYVHSQVQNIKNKLLQKNITEPVTFLSDQKEILTILN